MLITVFTPTYNREHTIHRVYDSLKNQNLKIVDNKPVFEWVIVDDGSKDNTKELVKQWQKEASFPIRYFYQENRGKIHAMRLGIENAHSTLFLIADSDDAFLPETIETFYKTWNSFSDEEKKKCGGIGVLHNDQYGKPIGNKYPVEHEMLPAIDIIFKWRNLGIGDTWALLKTENLKKSFIIPNEAKNLKFIPETFFWDRIVFDLKPYSYFINKRLGIVYRNEGGNISQNIRLKYPDGFLFESKWFINHYKFIFFKSPKTYIKHFLKYIIFSLHNKEKFKNIMSSLDGIGLKIFFMILYVPAILLKSRYLKGSV